MLTCALPSWKDTRALVLDWQVGNDKKDGIERCKQISAASGSCKIWSIAATITILVISILSGGFLALGIGGFCSALTYDLYRLFDNLQQLAEKEAKDWDQEADKGIKIKSADYVRTEEQMKDRYKHSLANLCRGTGALRFVLNCYFDSAYSKIPPVSPVKPLHPSPKI